MSLGKRICALRLQRGLSQGELAEALEVSRQSVSKWETDGSVPELDKLIRLSGLFGVTLDELVKGAPDSRAGAEPEPSGGGAPAAGVEGGLARRIAGIILLCFGALGALLLLLLGGGLFSFLYAGPFLACGVICLAARRRAGLWCAWSVCLSVDLYLRYATGITWSLIFRTAGYQPEWNYLRLVTGWAIFLFYVVLLICTLRSFRTLQIAFGRRRYLLLAAGWAALAGLNVLRNAVYAGFVGRLPSKIGGRHELLFFLNTCGGYLLLALLAALLVLSAAALRHEKKNRAK